MIRSRVNPAPAGLAQQPPPPAGWPLPAAPAGADRADLNKYLPVHGAHRATAQTPDATLIIFTPQGGVLTYTNQTPGGRKPKRRQPSGHFRRDCPKSADPAKLDMRRRREKTLQFGIRAPVQRDET